MDSYSIVLFEDISDQIFLLYDNDAKMNLIDFAFEFLGLPAVFCRKSMMKTQAFHRLVKDSMTKSEGSKTFKIFEKLLSSPSLCNFALLASHVLESDMSVADITKFEFARKVVRQIMHVYPQSTAIRFVSFVVELLRSKSSHFKLLFDTKDLDTNFKEILKAQQSDHFLWIAFIELQAITAAGQTSELLDNLSNKVMKTFQKTDQAALVKLLILDIYIRLDRNDQKSRVQLLGKVLDIAFSIVQDLGINTDQFSYLTKKSEMYFPTDEPYLILNTFATDFLQMFQMLQKLMISYMKIAQQKETKNTINDSFINKKKQLSLGDFGILYSLFTLFGGLTGKLTEQDSLAYMQQWQAVLKFKQSSVTNRYRAAYQQDKQNGELRCMAYLSANIREYIESIVGRLLFMDAFDKWVYQEVAPCDLLFFDRIVDRILHTSYQFQIVERLEEKGVSTSSEQTLALLFKLERVDSEKYTNLQSFILDSLAAQSLLDEVMKDKKRLLINKLLQETNSEGLPGLDLLLRNEAIIVLSEISLLRDSARDPFRSKQKCLNLIHATPYNKVSDE